MSDCKEELFVQIGLLLLQLERLSVNDLFEYQDWKGLLTTGLFGY
jgi:hypothetical protein